MKGERPGVEHHAALWALHHVAHDFTDFAEGADGSHPVPGAPDGDVFFDAEPEHCGYKRGAGRNPQEMVGGKHGDSPFFVRCGLRRAPEHRNLPSCQAEKKDSRPKS